MLKYILPLLLLLLLVGCDQSQERESKIKPQPEPTITPELAKPRTLLKEPVDLLLVETPTEALLSWREHVQQKPTLVLVSKTPFLLPVPEKYREQAIQLITHGSAEQIKARAVDLSADPILLHDMALSAALAAELFSEVIWLLPSTDKSKPLNLEEFKKQLLFTGVATPDEASSFIAQDDVFSGRIDEIPFRVTAQVSPLVLTSPAVVHIDLSYFEPLYKNEVKTPLYPMLAEQLGLLRDLNIQVNAAAVTLSFSNLGGRLPLGVRFLGEDLKSLIQNPELLNAPLSEFWFHRQQSLFLPNFFRNDETFEHLIAMEKLAPDDASVKFALYEISRELKKGDEALTYLERATQLDPVYALEYQNLSNIAIQKGQPLAALKMLDKAATYFPANPLIKLATADIQLRLGHRTKALELLHELSALPWSDVYDSEMPARLEKMIAAANQLPESKRD